MADKNLSRRRFVQVSALAAAATTLGARGTCLLAGEPAGKRLFRFIQCNDTHVEATRPSDYLRANQRFAHLVELLGKAAEGSAPDFVVGVGDLIHGENLHSLAPDLERFKGLAAHLKVPLFPVVGNHENVQREGDAVYEAAYREHFGADRTNYTFEHGGVLFVALNNSGAPASNRTEVGQRRNAWLRDVLEDSGDRPKIICCHIPLVPVREESVLKKSFGFGSYIAHDAKLLGLVEAYSDSVVAVLSGHLHLSGVIEHKVPGHGGFYQIVTSGTASYPSDFASYDVFPDRIHVQMHSLPEGLLEPTTNIHGKHRHGIDYTDATHRTHEAYIRGNAEERMFDIALKGKKRISRP
ncbi:MAG: metallophosphoesterase [Planctomycetota bacterium]|nr:metallophosphoesterase [Planctomycetota bacterium]